MPYYKDTKTGERYFFDDENDAFPHLVRMTDKQVADSMKPKPAELAAMAIDAVQAELDRVARSMRYDNILSMCSYSNSTNAKFKAESLAAIAWRDACWEYLGTFEGRENEVTLAEIMTGLPSIQLAGG